MRRSFVLLCLATCLVTLTACVKLEFPGACGVDPPDPGCADASQTDTTNEDSSDGSEADTDTAIPADATSDTGADGTASDSAPDSTASDAVADACTPTCSGPIRTCGTAMEVCPVTCNAGACVSANRVVVGANHSCALMSDGSVRCWGAAGVIGDGGGSHQLMPVPITIPETVSAISAISAHTCVRTTTGKAYCWGKNDNGELGEGTTFSSTSPRLVTLVGTVNDICVGSGFTCALTGGVVKCWGLNTDGVVGKDPTFTSVPTPNTVPGLTAPTAVSCGYFHACALDGGTVKCWGSNTAGQLGDGTKTSRYTAAATVPSMSGVEVTASYRDTCVRAADGSAKCFGDNSYSQLGDTAAEHLAPFSFGTSLKGIKRITTGVISCAATAGDPICSGSGSDVPASTSPVAVPSLSGATDVAIPIALHFHGCAAVSGKVKCWGYGTGSNADGVLGDGSTGWHMSPEFVKWY
jgi:hypothetical protein